MASRRLGITYCSARKYPTGHAIVPSSFSIAPESARPVFHSERRRTSLPIAYLAGERIGKDLPWPPARIRMDHRCPARPYRRAPEPGWAARHDRSGPLAVRGPRNALSAAFLAIPGQARSALAQRRLEIVLRDVGARKPAPLTTR